VVSVNIVGVANVIRAFAPAMIERGSGVIVNLSSGWGRSVSPEVAPYCATKWAIEGMTKALAEELPKGMAAVPLNPGRHRHRHAAHLLLRGRLVLSEGRGMGRRRPAPFILGWGPRTTAKSAERRRLRGLSGPAQSISTWGSISAS
jgi:NAD(P)-dependent dehydrogenase (short-subunit alcohol dehydrogenase family)